MNKIKSPQEFPQAVKRGSFEAKIYRTPSRGREAFTLCYWEKGRQRRVYAKLADAKAEAAIVATRPDWACYLRAKQLSDSVNLPLESVALQFVELKGGTDARRRRLMIIECSRPKAERRIGGFATQLVNQEASGIRWWMIQGAIEHLTAHPKTLPLLRAWS